MPWALSRSATNGAHRACSGSSFEDGHVAEAKDPPGVIRAEKGKDMTEMLVSGELDAAIHGAAMPGDPRLQGVVANPNAEAKLWYAKHKRVPINHMVVVTNELAKAGPEAVTESDAGGKPRGCRHGQGRDRRRAVRQGRDPSVPRAVDFLRRAVGPDRAAAQCG